MRNSFLEGDSRVSIYDIAKKAGVNPSSVSRALNNRGRIGKDTKERILAIAKEMGYQPSAAAQSLVSNRTMTIGVVLPSLEDPFLGELAEGIELAANEKDYVVHFASSLWQSDREMNIAKNFQRRRVDGVIIAASHQKSTYDLFENSLNVPLVVIGQQNHDLKVSYVSIDNEQAAISSANHLLSLGHRNFGFVGVTNRPFSSIDRGNCFKAALLKSPFEITYLAPNPHGKTDIQCGQAAIEEIAKSKVTAIQCYNDMVALGFVAEANRRGIRIPEDISVIGYDDIRLTEALPIGLTTIRQPRKQMAKKAVDLVLDLMENPVHHHLILKSDLIIRGTTSKLLR